MHEFTDNTGRKWLVEINISAVKNVRGLLNLDLLDLGHETLATMVDDPVALCDVLYVLCREQARAAGVSDEDFGRGMRGDAIDGAVSAFISELTDFTPSRRRRLLQAAMEKMKILEDRATEKTMMMLTGDRLDRLLEEKLEEKLDETLCEGTDFGGESTSSPASPASTPGR